MAYYYAYIMPQYDHKKIEVHWQKEWEKSKLYKTSDKVKGKEPASTRAKRGENFYSLVEFPYPSGNLHTGHWYAFSVPDIFARKKRMEGKNVLFPIGFDAFGLPAENAAIKRGLNPKKWTYSNIDYMKRQLRSMGASFDWLREVITSDPEYYKWTQWIFLQFYKKGLAYQAETPVNWCPKDKTVLANEQVVGGKCDRCGSEVEQRIMKQWMLKITNYAERLLSGLDKLNWPEEIKEAQKNWIGKSEGAEIEFVIPLGSEKEFKIADTIKFRSHKIKTILSGEKTNSYHLEEKNLKVGDYTKIIDWGNGRTIAIAKIVKVEKKKLGGIPLDYEGHEVWNSSLERLERLELFYKRKVTDEDTTWVYHFELVALVAMVFTTRPDTLYGATYLVLAPEHELVQSLNNKIKNWDEVKKYIGEANKKTPLERQQEAKTKTGAELKGIKAINPANGEEIPIWIADYVLASYGTGAIMAVPQHDERDREFALKFNLPIVDRPLADKNEIIKKVSGRIKIQYRLRDWVVSRQRYWGVPIPMIHCLKCGVQAVLEKDLPVKLPDIKDYLPTGEGKSPLAKAKKWLSVQCPVCKGKAERETDTLDTFVDSSWYFLRYCDPENNKKFADAKKMGEWMPVDVYSGGAEHTNMHLLYSRFWYKAMYDCDLIPKEFGDEPYKVRKNRGIILGPDGQKMSKSRGNVIDPDEYIAKFGADTVRMYLAFIGPYNEVGSYPWDPHGILGLRRFLDRVWSRYEKFELHPNVTKNSDNSDAFVDLDRLLHKTIKKVTEDIDGFRFNTAISAMMMLLNEIEKTGIISIDFLNIFLKLLSPFAPHLTEEIWFKLGNKKSIHLEPWPEYDSKLIEDDIFELIVQINGKVRDKFNAPINISKEEAERLTLAREKIKLALENKKPPKIIFVPKRLINIVI